MYTDDIEHIAIDTYLEYSNNIITLLSGEAPSPEQPTGEFGEIIPVFFSTNGTSSPQISLMNVGALELSGGTNIFREYISTGAWTGIPLDSDFYVNTYTSVPRPQSMTFSRADGSHVYGEQIVILRDEEQLNTSICSYSGSTARYVPFWMAEKSTNPSETGVIPDDGFNGYLSTDVIRCVRSDKFSRGQLFDGGQFIYIGGGGVVIAWDPSITESIY